MTYTDEQRAQTRDPNAPIWWPAWLPRGVRDMLVAWLRDENRTIEPSVDQQAAFLTRNGMWSGYGEYITGHAKDFLSDLMFRKLVFTFPAGTEVRLIDRVGYPTMESVGILVPSEGYIDTTVLSLNYGTPSTINTSIGWTVNPWHLSKRSPSEQDQPEPTTPAAYVPTPEHLEDMERMSQVFWHEAKERQWCSEAEEVITGLNHYLNVKLQAERPVDRWDVKVSGAFGCGYFMVYKVQADCAQDAIDHVKENIPGEWDVDSFYAGDESTDESRLGIPVSALNLEFSATEADDE